MLVVLGLVLGLMFSSPMSFMFVGGGEHAIRFKSILATSELLSELAEPFGDPIFFSVGDVGGERL